MFDDTYKEVKNHTTGIYKEKGSKFIANTYPVYSEKEEKDKANVQLAERKDCEKQKDASDEERAVHEINSGIYVFDACTLFRLLPLVGKNNKQNEYYLPDVINMIVENHGKIGIYKVKDCLEIQGINTNKQLENLKNEFRKRVQ